MTTTSTFECETCYDTQTIDHGGREIACPDCQTVTVKLTGIAHGLGVTGSEYRTAASFTASTITFVAASRGQIIADARRVLADAQSEARRQGLTGRNYVTSGPTAILKRILATS